MQSLGHYLVNRIREASTWVSLSAAAVVAATIEAPDKYIYWAISLAGVLLPISLPKKGGDDV